MGAGMNRLNGKGEQGWHQYVSTDKESEEIS